MTPEMTPDAIAAHLAMFVVPNQVTELRALNVGYKGRTFAGWYDSRHLRDMARHALALSREAAGVYFIPNPIDPTLLSRRPNECSNVYRDNPKLTRDSDILERRYLIVDIDPSRWDPPTDKDCPSSDEELRIAKLCGIWWVKLFLNPFGFDDPITIESGNGIHLVYRLQEPIITAGICGPDDPLAITLSTMSEQLDNIFYRIDRNTYNPSRMLRVPGTWNRKGESTQSRPYRISKIAGVPDGWLERSYGTVTSTDTISAGGSKSVRGISGNLPVDFELAGETGVSRHERSPTIAAGLFDEL